VRAKRHVLGIEAFIFARFRFTNLFVIKNTINFVIVPRIFTEFYNAAKNIS
jgi:hypothetical protein